MVKCCYPERKRFSFIAIEKIGVIMKKIKKHGLAALLALAVTLPVIAAMSQEPAAIEMLKKAEALYKKVGAEAAKAEFNKPDGSFVNGDLYVYCAANSDHKFTAHPIKKALIGVDIYTLKDVDNFEFGKEMMTAAEAGKIKTIEYKWPNPKTKEMGVKRAYYENFGADTCAVALYKD